MLVASSPIVRDQPFRANPSGSLPLPSCRVVQNLSAFPIGKAASGSSSRRGPRQAVGRVPKSPPVRLAVPAGSLPPVWTACLEGSIPTVPSGASVGPVVTGPPDAPSGPRRFGQRLRSTRGICGSPGQFTRNLRGVFSNAAAGIAAVSIGLNLSSSFRGLRLQECEKSAPFDKQRLRSRSESCKYFL
jgi:hypothetical protein